MDVCAGIVTYNPDINRLKQNVKSIIKQVEFLIIVDNASDNVNMIEKICDKYNIRLIRFKKNEGIAKALNTIMQLSLESHMAWTLLLDQDSICPLNIIETYNRYTDLKKLAVIVPNIYDLNDGERSEKLSSEITTVVEFITSGSLNNVRIWKEIGGFDNKLFIDMVDYDYAYRLNMQGYSAIKVGNVILKHEIGHRQKYKLGCFEFVSYNHSAFRKYYIIRNSLYLARKYPKYCNPIIMRLKIIKRILIVILFEEQKKEKLKSMIKGVVDYHKLMCY